MKLNKLLAIMALAMAIPVVAFADSATFGNNDGKFTATSNTGALSITAANHSYLTQITGLSPLIMDQAAVFNSIANNCPTMPGCLGSVTLMTGALNSGTLTNQGGGTNATSSATFAPGGFFTVTGQGFVFTTTFATAMFTCSVAPCNATASTPTKPNNSMWVFNGTFGAGTLTVGSQTWQIDAGGTVQLTTAGGLPVITRNASNQITGITFKDNSGTTTYPSPVPEPGTLTLLGSGLVSIGMLAKRKLANRKS